MMPLAMFDSIEHIDRENNFSCLDKSYNVNDIMIALKFLKSYTGSQDTFNSYRREIERLIH